MKKSVIGVFLVLFVLFVFVNLAFAENECTDRCQGVSELAKVIMSARQYGVPLSDVLELNKGASKLAESMILTAYSKPLYLSEKLKKAEIVEFQNSVLVSNMALVQVFFRLALFVIVFFIVKNVSNMALVQVFFRLRNLGRNRKV